MRRKRQPKPWEEPESLLPPAHKSYIPKVKEIARLPLIRNKDGLIVWKADRDKFYYRDPQTNKLRRCSCSITGDVVVVKDGDGNLVEAYKLRAGETVEFERKVNRAKFYEQPLLELYIDPGNASVETLQAVLQALSDLHFSSGGLGLEFVNDGNFICTSEKVTT